MDEIRNALNAGKEVITHADAVSVPGWSGAGYIITDPLTGDGAYKISGGGNGSFIAGILLGSAIFIFLSALFVPALAALVSTLILFSVLLVVFSIYLLLQYQVVTGCVYAGLLANLAIWSLGGLWFEVEFFDRVMGSISWLVGIPSGYDVSQDILNCFNNK